jgi:hypothetical protein
MTLISRNALPGLCLLLSACGTVWHDGIRSFPAATIEHVGSPVIQIPRDAVPMSGPLTTIMPTTRNGAALVLAHTEPVLRLPPPPLGPAVTPLDALRDIEPVAPRPKPASVESTAELAELAAALYRFCHHWPAPDDLTSLIAHGLVTAGQQSSEACPALD